MKLNKLAGYRSMLNIPRKNIAELLQISNVAYGKKEKGITPFTDNEKVILVNFFKNNGINTNIEDLFF
ncbi:transcriptional regulator [Gemelliphila palaticanis]|uniref:Transcriptional regulator n=1 Tax=Gemelliphila palaticanis TaxID=81950 RepID=A0ABX2SWR0_9BACL|nr:transcriptional regulator [Gemella palaticanis]MBF0714665.1 transcriptional regulator [Gemella palaticanis]NYS46595.1 transcriptional regulator [Gemella palaticanis]